MVRFPADARDSLFCKAFTSTHVHAASQSMNNGGSFPEGKAAGEGRLPFTSTSFQSHNAWSYTPLQRVHSLSAQQSSLHLKAEWTHMA